MKHTIFFGCLFSLVFCINGFSQGQTKIKALFLGNSYTAQNNLPQLIANLSQSVGDTLIFDSRTPGGYRLESHVADALSIQKVKNGGWNYVVLQGQSQEPILITSRFNQAGQQLTDSIKKYNYCAVPLFYVTWGRKNGDAANCPQFPEMCTYQKMDSTLNKKYSQLAQTTHTEISPVSSVWRYLRQNYPQLELYTSDGSHPSFAGSYAAACTFYTLLFKKNPTFIQFNGSLSAADASIIRIATKIVVYDQLNQFDYKQPPSSQFNFWSGTGNNETVFLPLNPTQHQTYFWNFGDGNVHQSPGIVHHSYTNNGSFQVTLTTKLCHLNTVDSSRTDTLIQWCNHTPTIYHKNALLCQKDTLWTEPSQGVQWLLSGMIIPETKRYLANYAQYNGSEFSVLSTQNNCTELSTSFTANPLWQGYYFDAAHGGDPCTGDTALFTVHNTQGFSGFEWIRWYRNNQEISEANNNDTLYITKGGTYFAKLIDLNSVCKHDTTISTSIVFECPNDTNDTNGLGDIIYGNIPNNHQQEVFNVFPNPALQYLVINFKHPNQVHDLLIYNVLGELIDFVAVKNQTKKIDISSWPSGLLFIVDAQHKQKSLLYKL